MKNSGDEIVVYLVCLVLLISSPLISQPKANPVETAEGLITEIYKLVTFEAGERPDWEKVRALFADNAIVVLRTSRDSTTIFTVEGFVDDFIRFIDNSKAKEVGFSEKIVRTKPFVFKDIAHILVLYEAHIPGSPRAPQLGVDSWQLVKKNGRWWIISVTNEIPFAGLPVPKELQEQH